MPTISELIDKIESGQGTVQEDEQWLLSLQEKAPWFWQSDEMLQLEKVVQRRRRAAAIMAGMDSPPSPTQIAVLLESIDYSKVKNGDEIDELGARDEVIGLIIPYDDTRRYLERLIAAGNMTTEDAVRAVLSYQPKATFNLPGPVDENWLSKHDEG